MDRRLFLASATGGLAGLCMFDCKHAFGYEEPAYRIQRVSEWTIDNEFGNTETRILTDALAIFYRRFLQNYGWGDYLNGQWRGRSRSNAYSHVTGMHYGHYREGVNTRDIFGCDWLAMWQHFVDDNKPFPPITLRFINVPRGNFVAQAHLDMIVINDFPNNEAYKSTANPGSRGAFDIEINDWYLANSAEGRWYMDPEYYAGVIAHEAWHNLGHLHPPQRSDATYYLHQMILHEMCIMQNRSIRYGLQSGTPVYCRRHPG